MGTIATKTFVLLLAQGEPLNFIQGTNISLQDVLSQGNRKEFHHIFPKAYLQNLPQYKDDKVNYLSNFTLLSRTDNNKIQSLSPGKYRNQMPADAQTFQRIIASHFCPDNAFTDDYDNFLVSRSELLLQKAEELSQIS